MPDQSGGMIDSDHESHGEPLPDFNTPKLPSIGRLLVVVWGTWR
jgi:hypothetical protein